MEDDPWLYMVGLYGERETTNVFRIGTTTCRKSSLNVFSCSVFAEQMSTPRAGRYLVRTEKNDRTDIFFISVSVNQFIQSVSVLNFKISVICFKFFFFG